MDRMQEDEFLAREAYIEYGRAVDFKNFRGELMPMFDELPPKIQDAWKAAATAVQTTVNQWSKKSECKH